MDQDVAVDRSVTLTLTPDDFVRASQLSMIRWYKKPGIWWRYAAVGILMGLAVIGLLDGQLPPNPMVFIVIVMAALYIRLVLAYFFFVPATARKRFSQSKAFLGPIVYSWSEQEIQFFGELGSARLPWKDMADHAENDAMLLFYPTPRVIYIVPKRFLTRRQIADLINCASANME